MINLAPLHQDLILYLQELPKDSHRAMWAKKKIIELEKFENRFNYNPTLTVYSKKCRVRSLEFDSVKEAAEFLEVPAWLVRIDIHKNNSQTYKVYLV